MAVVRELDQDQRSICLANVVPDTPPEASIAAPPGLVLVAADGLGALLRQSEPLMEEISALGLLLDDCLGVTSTTAASESVRDASSVAGASSRPPRRRRERRARARKRAEEFRSAVAADYAAGLWAHGVPDARSAHGVASLMIQCATSDVEELSHLDAATAECSAGTRPAQSGVGTCSLADAASSSDAHGVNQLTPCNPEHDGPDHDLRALHTANGGPAESSGVAAVVSPVPVALKEFRDEIGRVRLSDVASFEVAERSIERAFRHAKLQLLEAQAPSHLESAYFLMRDYFLSELSGPRALIAGLDASHRRLADRPTDGDWYDEYTDDLENLEFEVEHACGRLDEIIACIEYADKQGVARDGTSLSEPPTATKTELDRLQALRATSADDIQQMLQERLRLSLLK